MASKGKIASWNDAKGFGFIAPDRGNDDVFCHIKAFANRNRRPAVGDAVTFSVQKDKQGRLRAARASFVYSKADHNETQKSIGIAPWFAFLFLVAVAISLVSGELPVWILYIYLAISILTFIVYTIDKSAAQYGRWRTRETTLHMLAFCGGWPGALVAQRVLRHKSRKPSFRVVFWLSVVLNCAALAWLHTPTGSAQLQIAIEQGQTLIERARKSFDTR